MKPPLSFSIFNQVNAARDPHVGGLAVSRLGTFEDPDIWDVLAHPPGSVFAAYRETISEPFWLGEVRFREQPKKKGVDLKR